ncbi:hypothetical protein [Pantoea vagans]|uniref:hypothetical protein n=1 Tax=Pantoea vagans TaxID=470934 RepID=UPI003015FF25
MVDEINVSESHLQTVLTTERTQPDTEADWMDEMDRELQETEKKWPVMRINWKP